MSTTTQTIIYKVWQPGQSPDGSDALLTLNNESALQFFVESIVNGSTLFANQAFALVAYRIQDQLFERPLAEGTFRFQREGKAYRVHALYESGYCVPHTGHSIVFVALRQALARKQVMPQIEG